jgi:phosphoribosylaminoimidazolecarboxamide formyltransferase/IMP cyclohydrolase
MTRALFSVYDKSGLVDFARGLAALGVELVASGGTGNALREAGLDVTTVEDLTGLPSVLGGRVKTLHPAIHGGILAQDMGDDRATLDAQGWSPIDLVVVNLYPFVETVSHPGVTLDRAVEQIDIGGVALIRAAAKNFRRVTVVTTPDDYDAVLSEFRAHGDTMPETRRRLAVKAFGVTAAYDEAITAYLTGEADAALPQALALTLPQAQVLRYGENPHQQAALYAPPGAGPLGGSLLQGKPLSYNNLLDLDAGRGLRRADGRDRQAPQPVRDRLRRRPGRDLPRRARLRSGVGLRRGDRLQPALRRGDCRGAGRPVRRGGCRAGLHRRGPRDPIGAPELPPAPDEAGS